MFGIRREQGRLEEPRAGCARSAAGNAGGALWRPALAALPAELGLGGEAARELEHVGRSFEGLRQGRLWHFTYLTDARCDWRPRHRGAHLPRAAAYEEVPSSIGYSVAFYGATDRYLGMLGCDARRPQRAQRHFAAAHELNRSTGAATWLARGREARRMLAVAGEHADAQPFLEEANALAEERGLASLLARARAVRLAGEPVRRGSNGELSSRETDVLRLVRVGARNRADRGRSSPSASTRSRIMCAPSWRKTGAGNRTDAASWAHQMGHVELPDPSD